jgi:hypothetical protein
VAYFILGCAASFSLRLCIHNKTRKKKRSKRNYCVYFIEVFVNQPAKKKKKETTKRIKKNTYNQLLHVFFLTAYFLLLKFNNKRYAESDWMCTKFFRRSTKRGNWYIWLRLMMWFIFLGYWCNCSCYCRCWRCGFTWYWSRIVNKSNNL